MKRRDFFQAIGVAAIFPWFGFRRRRRRWIPVVYPKGLRMRGRVGIGTANPLSKLHIKYKGGEIRIGST